MRVENSLWDTTDGSDSSNADGLFEELIETPSGWQDEPFWLLKYIDDGLGGEKILNMNAGCHFTTEKETKLLHAKKSEHFLKLTRQNARKIGMVINEQKTKMLTVSVARNRDINTCINIEGGQRIYGGETLKILEERRTNAIKKFAVKSRNNERFSSLWFEENDKCGLRYTERFKIKRANHDRLKNGPLNVMRNYLNSL